MKEERERTPLRIILQNFINHVENLETYRSENSYDKEFQDLKLFSENLKTSGDYSCKEGEKEFNRKKNRYKDILPFDYSRVTLTEYVGIPGSDYINANYIKGASGSPAYIASQGPLPHTVNDFWRMVVECEVQVIVMACNEEESGKHKCENYWVDKEGEEKKFGMVAIRLLKASTICPDFLVRTMQLKYINAHSVPEERVVCQFHYGAWPDHGVPGLVRPLLEMVRLVRDTQASETLPVLVHCSAGCGRTGTICAIDYVWGLLRAGKLRLDFSLFKLVRDMRKQRIAMVQTKDQYILVHQAVRELFQDQLHMIHSHPYENIDVRGHPLLPSITFKATIIQPRRAVSSDEKQDGREKESSIVSCNTLPEQACVMRSLDTGDAPPLPHKKRIHTVSSKQEKEVENLTQKQLSIATASSIIKVKSSCVEETFDKRDDQVISVLEKSLKISNSETHVKQVDKASDMSHFPRGADSGKNSSFPQSSCVEETVKASANCTPVKNVCDVHHSLIVNETEGVSNLQKPCIAKLKALFECDTSIKDAKPNVFRSAEAKPRLPQQVTRSHSLGAVRKPHKFSQFNAGSPEIGLQSQQSSDLNESGKFKSVSNIHGDICGPEVRGDEEITCSAILKTDHLKIHCPSSSNHVIHIKRGSSSVGKQLKLSPHVHLAGGALAPSSSFSGILHSLEKPSCTTDIFPPASYVSHEDPRPALPIKRSKSLKVQSTADHFKLSLAKRSHGPSQEVTSSEDDSNFSVGKSLDCYTEAKLHKKNSKEYGSLCCSSEASSFPASNLKMPCDCQIPPCAVMFNPAGSTDIHTSELNELPSIPVFINVNSDIDSVNIIAPTPSGNTDRSEIFIKCTEWKKVGEHVPKLNRDICRAQSLHVKREKTSPLISFARSQESEYVNVKKVDSGANARDSIEPLSVRVLSADDICKCVIQNRPQNSMPIDENNIMEDCRNYLLSEGFFTSNFNESQRIAAASARHKVDTVAGGLGIRERRNSFRCAVGQGVDEKSNRTNITNGGNKWPSHNSNPHLELNAEDISVKRHLEPKLTSSVVRLENLKLLKKRSDHSKGVECNVISKISPLFQKPSNNNECNYVANGVKLGENPGEINNLQKAGVRSMELVPACCDIAQKNVGLKGKKASDSSSFQTSSSTVRKNSVVTNVKKPSYIPSKHSSKSPGIEDLVLNSPKGGTHSEVHYHWPAHQANVPPQKKGNSNVAMHSADNLGSQSNQSSVVPMEVDVDQVAASMKGNLQSKLEGAKSPVYLENSNQGNNPASTHFTRALEVFHQTAASIRTKFSRPAAWSGTNSARISGSNAKGRQSSQNQLSVFQPQQNGNSKREERSVLGIGDRPQVLRKQQQYL